MQNLNMIEYRRYMFVNLQLVSLWNMDSFVPLLYSTGELEKRGWGHFQTKPGVTSRLNRGSRGDWTHGPRGDWTGGHVETEPAFLWS